ncbi:MAG: hypothetical protein KDB22_09010 [Planctomycetales bacterium]|nr:hypothetical protein [Planctomycetales bacterium]
MKRLLQRFATVVWILCLTCGNTRALPGQETATNSKSDSTLVEIPLEDGTISSRDLFHSVAGDLHAITGTVAGFSEAFNIGDQTERLSQEELQKLVQLFPDVFRFPEQQDATNGNFTVDKSALAALLADKKSDMRQWLSSLQGVEISSLTKVDSTWTEQENSPPHRIVVAMAGLHSLASSAAAIALELHQQTNLPMCVYEYPNDAPIVESARRLRVHLRELHQTYPSSQVTLVTHSMGGLVSRAALEMELADQKTPALLADNFGVDQLIQVCPPNHGSEIAQYGPLLEGIEQVMRIADRSPGRRRWRLLGMLTDGFNEAPGDLIPGSQFLLQLNGNERNPQVRYSILAGDDGPLREGGTALLGGIWQRVADAVREPEIVDQKIQQLLKCDDLQKGKGDGVVAVKSARLAGIDDFEVLNMSHLAWQQLDTAAGKMLVQSIVQRLTTSL